MGTVVLHIHCIQIRLIAHELCKVALPNTDQFILHYSHIFYMISLHLSSVLYGQGYFVVVVVVWVWFFSCLFLLLLFFKEILSCLTKHVIKPALFDTNK